jgi:hypothetical protein
MNNLLKIKENVYNCNIIISVNSVSSLYLIKEKKNCNNFKEELKIKPSWSSIQVLSYKDLAEQVRSSLDTDL